MLGSRQFTKTQIARAKVYTPPPATAEIDPRVDCAWHHLAFDVTFARGSHGTASSTSVTERAKARHSSRSRVSSFLPAAVRR